MHTSLSSQSRWSLAGVATQLSKKVEKQLARVQRDIQTESERRTAERAQRIREEAERKERQACGLAKRVPLARKGLERILATGRSEPLQKIISSFERLQNPWVGIPFYEASRPSGDAWDTDGARGSGRRDVRFDFRKRYLEITYGSFGVEATVWKLFYDVSSPGKAAQRTHDADEEEPKTTVDVFLGEIADPFPSNMSLIRHWGQRRIEWAPEDVTFQLLVSCARRSRFDNYLAQCLEGLKVSS